LEELVAKQRGVVADDGVIFDRDPLGPEHVRGRLQPPRDAGADGDADPAQQPVFQSEARADPREHDHDVVADDRER